MRHRTIAAAAVALFTGATSVADPPPPDSVRFTVVAKSEQEAPGIPGARLLPLSSTLVSIPSMSPDGAIAFHAVVEGAEAGITELNNTGIWATQSASDPTLRLVVREGDVAPGAGGAVFTRLAHRAASRPPGLSVGNGGRVVFSARVQSADEATDRRRGVWIATPNSDGIYEIELVALTSDPAPGAPGASFIDKFALEHLVNARGDVLIHGETDSVDYADDFGFAGHEGIWMSRAPASDQEQRTLMLVALAGEPAPDVGLPFWFFPVDSYEFQDQPSFSLTDTGEVAFVGRFSPSSYPLISGIWSGPPGALRARVLNGEPCPGAPGAEFELFGRPVINSAGDLAFRATLWTWIGGGSSAGGVLCTLRNGELSVIARDNEPAPNLPGRVFADQTSGWISPRMNDAGDLAFTSRLAGVGTAPGSALWKHIRNSDTLIPVALEGDGVTGFGSFEDHDSPSVLNNAYAMNAAGDVAFVNAGTASPESSRGLWLCPRLTLKPHRICEPGVTRINVASGEGAPDLRLVTRLVTWGSINSPPPRLSDDRDLAMTVRFEDGTFAVILAHTRRTPGPRSPADLDGDEVVTAADFTILAASYGRTVPAGTPADINADGVVNAADFLMFARDFGPTFPTP